MSDVNFTEWARLQGIHRQTACRWFREGTLPVPAVRVNSQSALVAPAQGGIGRYARVSCHDPRADLDRQVARLRCVAQDVGPASSRVVR